MMVTHLQPFPFYHKPRRIPFYSYLTQRGYKPQGEAIIIGDWPVQFLPVFNELIEEALVNAVDAEFGYTATHVLRAEYLAAIMLQTDRPKDFARLLQFIEFGVLNWMRNALSKGV